MNIQPQKNLSVKSKTKAEKIKRIQLSLASFLLHEEDWAIIKWDVSVFIFYPIRLRICSHQDQNFNLSLKTTIRKVFIVIEAHLTPAVTVITSSQQPIPPKIKWEELGPSSGIVSASWNVMPLGDIVMMLCLDFMPKVAWHELSWGQIANQSFLFTCHRWVFSIIHWQCPPD